MVIKSITGLTVYWTINTWRYWVSPSLRICWQEQTVSITKYFIRKIRQLKQFTETEGYRTLEIKLNREMHLNNTVREPKKYENWAKYIRFCFTFLIYRISKNFAKFLYFQHPLWGSHTAVHTIDIFGSGSTFIPTTYTFFQMGENLAVMYSKQKQLPKNSLDVPIFSKTYKRGCQRRIFGKTNCETLPKKCLITTF